MKFAGKKKNTRNGEEGGLIWPHAAAPVNGARVGALLNRSPLGQLPITQQPVHTSDAIPHRFSSSNGETNFLRRAAKGQENFASSRAWARKLCESDFTRNVDRDDRTTPLSAEQKARTVYSVLKD